MPVFLDTEFTSLLSPELLSLGLVTLDGRELYAELDLLGSEFGQARLAQADSLVRYEIVEGKFGFFPEAVFSSEAAVAQHATDWLLRVASSSPDGRLELAYDYNVDLELLTGLLMQGDKWSAVQAVVGHRNVGAQTSASEPRLAAEACLRNLRTRRPPLMRHHALADALALRASWQAWHLVHGTAPELAGVRRAMRATDEVAGAAPQADGPSAEDRAERTFAWLTSCSDAFDGRAPLELVGTLGGAERIEAELNRFRKRGMR